MKHDKKPIKNLNRLLIKIGIWGLWMTALLTILGLLIAMWAVVWSWAIVGTIVIILVLSIISRLAGEEDWFEL